MSSEKQIAHFSRRLASSRVDLAHRVACRDFAREVNEEEEKPFSLLVEQAGERAAVALAIRLDIDTLASSLRFLTFVRDCRLAEEGGAEAAPAASGSGAEGPGGRPAGAEDLVFVRAKAASALEDAGERVRRKVEDAFDFLAAQMGESVAVKFVLRFSVPSIGAALRTWTWLLTYKGYTPPLRHCVSQMFGRAVHELAAPPVTMSLADGDPQAEQLVMAIAMTKARIASLSVPDDVGEAVGDPFRYLVDHVGVLGAMAFFLRFRSGTVGTALRGLAMLLDQQGELPSFGQVLKEMGAPDREQLDGMPLLTETIQ